MISALDNHLLRAYLDGEMDEATAEAFEVLMIERPELAELVDADTALRMGLREAGAQPVAAAFVATPTTASTASPSVGEPAATAPPGTTRRPQRTRRRLIPLLAAASLLLAAGIGLGRLWLPQPADLVSTTLLSVDRMRGSVTDVPKLRLPASGQIVLSVPVAARPGCTPRVRIVQPGATLQTTVTPDEYGFANLSLDATRLALGKTDVAVDCDAPSSRCTRSSSCADVMTAANPMDISTSRYFHVDVFARSALTGNGLSVFLPCDDWSESSLQQLTLEMRQFESIFLSAIDAHGASARIFTMQEELPFAGHPLLGAAAVLHRVLVPDEEQRHWTLRLSARAVQVTTRRLAGAIFAEMDQGFAEFGDAIDAAQATDLLAALNLESGDLARDLPLQLVSTGLPYLIVPVTAAALDRSSVRGRELERLLARFGARFVYVLNPDVPEGAPGTTWATWKMPPPAAQPVQRRPTCTGMAASPPTAPSWCGRGATPVAQASSAHAAWTAASSSAARCGRCSPACSMPRPNADRRAPAAK